MRGVAKDLIVVTADSQIRHTVEALLHYRCQSLAISGFSVDLVSHPNQDPGCRTDAGSVLDSRRISHDKAIVIFDFDGCGEHHLSPSDLETKLETEFANRGWDRDRIAFIVIEPELESWLFGASFRQIEMAVSWSQTQGVREWLIERGHLRPGSPKPLDPKAAIESVLYQQQRPRSSKLFADLARTIGLARCQDRAFQKFRTTLRRWFPAE